MKFWRLNFSVKVPWLTPSFDCPLNISYRLPCKCFSVPSLFPLWAVDLWHLLVDLCLLQVSKAKVVMTNDHSTLTFSLWLFIESASLKWHSKQVENEWPIVRHEGRAECFVTKGLKSPWHDPWHVYVLVSLTTEPALAGHCSASICLSFFVFQKWECWTYWFIFAFCRFVFQFGP